MKKTSVRRKRRKIGLSKETLRTLGGGKSSPVQERAASFTNCRSNCISDCESWCDTWCC